VRAGAPEHPVACAGMNVQAQSIDPITTTLRRLMDERGLSYRRLAELTRDADPEARGVTYAYLAGLVSGREYPSPRALELIATSLDIDAAFFAEYRLDRLRRELNGREVGFEAAFRRFVELNERRAGERRRDS
jgi:transcriptional regulator with XRE-family HTH domain